uniref:Ubiquitin-like protease family profile domain-containing protein n=1 Tax=Zea mays TaxID=4577 RepID=A0A804MP84_MAIZE
MERAPFRDSPGQPRSHSATRRWKGADAPAAALTPRSSPRARYPWMERAPFQDAPAPTPAILAPTLLSVDGRAWMPPQPPHPTVLARDSPVMLANYFCVYSDKHPRDALVSCRDPCNKYGDSSSDSLGTSQDRKDLTDSIKGLQRQIDMISQRKELKDHSSSCGLFLLNYIEYWTGDELSDSFTQDDMSHFRKKNGCYITIFRPE